MKADALDRDADVAERELHKLAHAVHLAGGQDEVVGLLLLQDAPHALRARAREKAALGRHSRSKIRQRSLLLAAGPPRTST